MAGTTFASLQDLRASLIRKTLNYSVFLAPSTADVVDETLFDATTGAIKTLPAGYLDAGYVTDDGAKFSKDVTRTDITSLQSTNPTRSDVTAGSTSITFEAQETKLATIGLYTDTAITDLTPDATSGVLAIDDPAIPSGLTWRMAAISMDYYGGSPIYVARIMPKAVVSKFNDQSFDKGDANTWGVTMDALFDEVAGTAHRWLFGGEGWLALQADMGFSAGLPIIASVAPASLAVDGGTLVTIKGQSLTGATAVTFDGTAATSFTVIDSQTISAVAPAHAAGAGLAVTVTTPAGTSTGGPTVTFA